MSATEPLTPISGCVTQGRSLSVQWRRDTANHKKQEQTKKKSRKSSAARHPDGRDKLEASPSRSREQQRITIKNPTKKKKGIHCQRINLSITHHQETTNPGEETKGGQESSEHRSRTRRGEARKLESTRSRREIAAPLRGSAQRPGGDLGAGEEEEGGF